MACLIQNSAGTAAVTTIRVLLAIEPRLVCDLVRTILEGDRQLDLIDDTSPLANRRQADVVLRSVRDFEQLFLRSRWRFADARPVIALCATTGRIAIVRETGPPVPRKLQELPRTIREATLRRVELQL